MHSRGDTMTLPEIGRTGIQEAINEWIIGEHAERDRTILARRLIDGITFERLAEEFDLSVRYVKTIVYKNAQVISSHLPGNNG